jgi:hypothetical protein
VKIIFVNRFYAPDHSATSQMLTDLAAALAADGAELHVVTSRLRYDDPQASLAAQELIDGVFAHRVRTSTFGRGNLFGRALDYVSFYFAAGGRLFGLVRARDVIVAMTDPPLVSVVAGWVARLRGARLVNWLQDLFPEVAANLGMASARGLVVSCFAGYATDPAPRGGERRARAADASVWSRWASILRRLRNTELGRWDAVRVGGSRYESAARRMGDGVSSSSATRATWAGHEFKPCSTAELAGADGHWALFVGGGAQRPKWKRSAGTRLLNVVFKPYQPRSCSTRAWALSMYTWSRCARSWRGSSFPASSTALQRSAGRRSSSATRRARSGP